MDTPVLADHQLNVIIRYCLEDLPRVVGAKGLMSRVLITGPGDATLLSTQHYKVRIEGKLEQSREWSNALPYTSV